MRRLSQRSENRRGMALVMALILIAIMATLGMSALDISWVSLSKSKAVVSKELAFHQAEGGVARAVELLNSFMLDPNNVTEADIFQSTDENPKPIKLVDGDITYYIEVRDAAGSTGEQNELKVIRCTAVRAVDGGNFMQSVEAVVKNTEELSAIYNNAIFAGNTSETANYQLELGGTGNATDIITGSVYSNGNIKFKGDSWSQFTNTQLPGYLNQDENRKARATGSVVDTNDDQISDTRAKSGVSKQDIITREDIDAVMDAYPEYVINVKNEFNTKGKSAYNATASFTNSSSRTNHYDKHRDWVIDDKDNPAHIFTRGKKKDTNYTGSNDATITNESSGSGYATTTAQRNMTTPPFGANTYHLEDPFETNSSGNYGSYNQAISLSGGPSKPFDKEGNKKIYVIEGDLWIHNSQVMDFAIKHAENNGIQMAFVVLGDIYFSDNVLFQNQNKDLFLFMALKKDGDADGAVSGNIHIGDNQFGTVENLDTMLYAENNFNDRNLTASGSAEFVINGNMTAGNQVKIDRDSGSQHSKMTVNYESRLTDTSQQAQNFRDSLPDWMKSIIYKNSSAETRNFKVVSFRTGSDVSVTYKDATGQDLSSDFNEVLQSIDEHNEEVIASTSN